MLRGRNPVEGAQLQDYHRVYLSNRYKSERRLSRARIGHAAHRVYSRWPGSQRDVTLVSTMNVIAATRARTERRLRDIGYAVKTRRHRVSLLSLLCLFPFPARSIIRSLLCVIGINIAKHTENGEREKGKRIVPLIITSINLAARKRRKICCVYSARPKQGGEGVKKKVV